MSGKVCLIEDDPTIRELVAESLKEKGYVVGTFDRAEPFMLPELADWDLYIVDIMLAGQASGLDLCRHLRQLSPTLPILILSALSEPSDRIEGLRQGADDYLAKPFEMEELLLRVDGMLKRRLWYAKLPREMSVFEWDGNQIDFVRFEGRRGKETVQLTQKECMLMKLLIEREGEVVSRDEILNRVWGYDAFPSNRTVDNFILRLRKCFEKVPKEPKYLHSVRGMGYKFTR
jgi:two-component system, OmpR family, alkaline phosphatase synthesis response regulator PhoP